MTTLEEVEIDRLNAEIERLRELLRGVGANRYWEGRWRDADKECERLLAVLEFVRTDPCFKVLGTVTHDMVTDALGLTEILTMKGG